MKIFCLQIRNLTPADVAKLKPAAVSALSAKDRAALELRRREAPTFPVVDPSTFADPIWLEHARLQARRLTVRRAFLTRQLAALDANKEAALRKVIENDELIRHLLEDNIDNALTVIVGLADAFVASGGLTRAVVDSIAALARTAQAAVNVPAAARAKDPAREADKVFEAAIAIKNLVVTSSPSLTARQRDAVVRGSDAVSRLARLSRRYVDGEPFDGAGAAAAAEDVVKAVATIPRLELVGAALATVNLAAGEYALGRLEGNRDELWRAYQGRGTAREFLVRQIEQADAWLIEYRRFVPEGR